MLDTRLESCPACGCALPARYADRCACGIELPAPHEFSPEKADGAVLDASSLEPPEFDWLPVEEAARATFGEGWLPGECWLVHGPAGSGKSRCVLRWASVRRALVVSLEMPPRVTAHVARSAGANASNLALTEDPDWRRHIGRRRLLVIDSVTEYRDPVSTVREVAEWCAETGGIAWLIAQETSDGEARGGPSVRHEADAVMRVTPAEVPGRARVAVHKRRLAPPGLPSAVELGRPDGVRALAPHGPRAP